VAIVVLVLWLFTAGAGFYLLVTSSLGRARSAAPEPAAADARPAPASTAHPAAAQSVPVPQATPGAPAATAQPAQGRAQGVPADPGGREASRREMRRAARYRWDPPSLTAAKQAPMLPEARSVMEFAHPTCGLVGLGFWLGFTLIHARGLGWIAFGLIALTAGLGLAWFTANVRAARRGNGGRPASFSGRLMVLHGCAAAVTITLAALTALVLRG